MKMVKIGGMILPLLLGATIQVGAATIVIDFESLAHNDAEVTQVDDVMTYQEDGYLLVNLSSKALSGFTPSFSTYGQQVDYGYTGSTALMNDNLPGKTILYTIGSGLFSISSIQVSEMTTWSDYYDVITFVGTYANGSKVTQEFAINGVFGYQNLIFNANFTDLYALEWNNGNYGIQIDNINVSSSPVPEPATMLLFGAGLVALTATGRSRRTQF